MGTGVDRVVRRRLLIPFPDRDPHSKAAIASSVTKDNSERDDSSADGPSRLRIPRQKRVKPANPRLKLMVRPRLSPTSVARSLG